MNMNRKFKLLILSLLGFSAACSGVKNSSKSQAREDADTLHTVVRPDIRLMYGVRRPMPVVMTDTLKAQQTEPSEAKSRAVAPDSVARQVQTGPRIVAMYGVRVPMENIDLDSLKQAQQEQAARRQNDNEQE